MSQLSNLSIFKSKLRSKTTLLVQKANGDPDENWVYLFAARGKWRFRVLASGDRPERYTWLPIPRARGCLASKNSLTLHYNGLAWITLTIMEE